MNPDIIVIGAGTVGGAIGYALARKRLRVLVLDGDDGDYRAGRAKFGLVWLQGHGMTFPAYHAVTARRLDVLSWGVPNRGPVCLCVFACGRGWWHPVASGTGGSSPGCSHLLNRPRNAVASSGWCSAGPIYDIAEMRQMVRDLQTMLTNAGVDGEEHPHRGI